MNIGEDRILDFLDGRLATPDEEELLHTLAVSPERREVLRAHINLRQMTSSLAREEQFNVPDRLTSRLFDQLSEMGYSAPVDAGDILTRAPEFVSSRIADGVAEGIGAATAGGVAGFSSGWRFGAISLLTASLVSFILGAGAYYVFGSALGLRTHPEEIAATRVISRHLAMPVAPAQQYDMAMASVAHVASPLAVHRATEASLAEPIGLIGPVAPLGQVQQNTVGNQPGVALMPAISFTAPRDPATAVSAEAPKNIPSAEPVWPDAIPPPIAEDRGTISVRFGLGPAPEATNAPVTTLSEFRFGWKMGYFIGAASMGQLNSIERSAQATPKYPADPSKGMIISTPENSTPVSTTLIGLDAGITLDPLGVPVDALVGFMYSGIGSSSGYSTFYDRASLMVHFEPWRELTVSGGIEGMWYSHDLAQSISHQQAFYKHYATSLAAGAVTKETCGLVGPTLEFGWHF